MTPECDKKPQDGQIPSDTQKMNRYPKGSLFKRLLRIDLRAEAVVNLDNVAGEIDPRIYGHFMGGLENYSWAGSNPDRDVTALVEALHPPLFRFSLGKFSSEAQKTALDTVLVHCAAAGVTPYLTIDICAATPEDAASWVTYCDTLAGTTEGDRYPAVGLWGLGCGHLGEEQAEIQSAEEYLRRVAPFIAAMRVADSGIQLAAAGIAMLPDDLQTAEAWNSAVLAGIGDQINYLFFQMDQPDETGWMETGDPEQWYHSILSAPHSVEEAIERIGRLIQEVAPEREIGIILDAFRIRLPGGSDAQNESDSAYALRDGLYVASMLNVFQRQSEILKVACLAHGPNQQSLIVKPEENPAFTTPLYFPYQLYSMMESQLLSLAFWSPVFKAEALGGTISERNKVPYIDLVATRSPDGKRVVLGVMNRSPQRKAKVMVNFRKESKRKFRVVEAQMMTGPDPLAVNTADAPNSVSVRTLRAPTLRFAWLDLDLPPASLMVVVMEEK